MIPGGSLATNRTATIATLVVVCGLLGLITSLSPLAAAVAIAVLVAMALLVTSTRPVLIVFFTFLVLQDPLRFLSGGEETQLGFLIKRGDEALLFPLAAWTLMTSSSARTALRANFLGWTIGACFVGIIASTLVAGQEIIPAAMDLALFAKPFMLFAIGASLATGRTEIRRGIGWLVPSMIAVATFGLLFLAFPQLQESYIGDFRRPDERLGFISAQGIFDNAGVYSWFCAATFAIAYAAGLAFRRNVYLFAGLVAIGFTVLSWRRKSLAAVFAILMVAVLVRTEITVHTRRRAVAILALAVVLAATALAPFLISLWDLTVTDYVGDPYASARTALHYTSVLIAIDHFPLGAGLASFGSHASRVYYSPLYFEYGLSNVWGLSPQHPTFVTDTFWPMVLGQGGVVTLIPYMCFLTLLIVTCWRRSRALGLSPDDRFIALASLFLLVGSLLESTASHIYDSTLQSSLALVLPGMAWARAHAATASTDADAS